MTSLRTGRLLLRRWRDADRDPFAALNADSAVVEHLQGPLSRERSDAFVDRIEAHWESRGWGLWAIGWGLIALPIVCGAMGMTAVAVLGGFALVLAAPFIYSIYKSIEWRWWVSGIRFGDVTVHSNLQVDALQGLYWKTIGWYMLLGTAFGALIGGAGALVGSGAGST